MLDKRGNDKIEVRGIFLFVEYRSVHTSTIFQKDYSHGIVVFERSTISLG